MVTENRLLEQCVLIKKNINKISFIMENAISIEDLDVTLSIKDVVNEFLEVINFEKINLSSEQIKNINSKIKEIKELLVELKNKQVYLYNLKVQEINDKIENFKRLELISDLNEQLDKLSVLRYSSVYLYRDWKNNNYSRLLDYDKLIEVYDIVNNVEKSIDVKDDEPIDLSVRINFCEHTLIEIKKEISDNMSMQKVNVLLDKCVSLFGSIVETDILIRKYVADGSLKEESKKNYRITTLYSKLTKIKNRLLEEKNNVDFSTLKSRLQLLDDESKKIQGIISNYYGKCNDIIVRRLNTRLVSLNENLNIIKKDIEKLEKDGKLDYNQISQLDLEIKKEKELFATINELLMNSYMLEDNLNENFNNIIIKLRSDIENLKKNVSELDIKNKSKIEDINLLIMKIKIDIQYLESYLFDKSFSNITLKNDLKQIKNKFNNICDDYNKNRPLSIKKIKSLNHLYDKYNKNSLLVSGLSSLTLLENSPIIPAIMHSMIVMMLNTPVLCDFVNSVNNILGGVINARRDKNGRWILSNGIEIGPSVAVTSLFQGLSVFKIANVPVIKNIVNIGRKMNLKYKQIILIKEEDKLKI